MKMAKLKTVCVVAVMCSAVLGGFGCQPATEPPPTVPPFLYITGSNPEWGLVWSNGCKHPVAIAHIVNGKLEEWPVLMTTNTNSIQ